MKKIYKARKKNLPFAKPDFGKREKKAINKVLDSGWLTSGPEVIKFEKEFAKSVDAKEAIALNSCTAGLHLCASAWSLSSEDAVLVPAITFTATAEVFTYNHCLPLILDVDRKTYLLTPSIVQDFIQKNCEWKEKKLVHKASQRKIQALVPVHLGGRSCDMNGLIKIAQKYDLKILNDAAHAFPSFYKDKKIGSMRDATAFSFYATKNLSTGEGGMLCTNNSELAQKVRYMRLHGIKGQSYGRKRWHYDVVSKGYKYNMMDMCASLGRVQLARSYSMLEKRKKIHNLYDQELKGIKWISLNPKCVHQSSYHLYVIEIKKNSPLDRNTFVEELYARNISSSLHFIPLYRLSYYQKKYKLVTQDYPNSEEIYQNILSLPIYSAMKTKDAKDVIFAIQDIFDAYQNKS